MKESVVTRTVDLGVEMLDGDALDAAITAFALDFREVGSADQLQLLKAAARPVER